MGKYFDSESYEDSYILNLIKNWHPVMMYPDGVYQPMSRDFSEDVDKMNEWCDNNCSGSWTTVWVTYFEPTYWFFFKSKSDAVHFSLVWSRTFHSQNQ